MSQIYRKFHTVSTKIFVVFTLLFSAFVTHAQNTGRLDNPLAFPTIQEMIISILNALIILSVPIIVFFVIFSGFMYVTAQGNPEKIKTAGRSLVYAIIGAVIIIGASAIMAIVESTVTQFSS